MSRPFFTVVTPSFNQGSAIAACIESVAAQDDPSFEHLIFDNLSSDETASVVAGFPGVKFVSEADRGQSHAVNKGFAAARGEVVCWLNADDAYPPGTFAALREAFADPAVHVVFGDAGQIFPDGRRQTVEARFEDRLDLVRWWDSRARLHQPAVFFRRTAREATGFLREDLHYAMDYEYWWRMSERFAFRKLPRALAIQHRGAGTKTMAAWRKVYAERERVFAPHYGLVDGGDRRALLREKRRILAGKYRLQAFAAADSGRPALAARSLWWMLMESPSAVFSPAWLGVVRRCLARRPAEGRA